MKFPLSAEIVLEQNFEVIYSTIYCDFLKSKKNGEPKLIEAQSKALQDLEQWFQSEYGNGALMNLKRRRG